MLILQLDAMYSLAAGYLQFRQYQETVSHISAISANHRIDFVLFCRLVRS